MVAQGSIFAGLDSEGIGRLDSRTDIVVVPVEIGSRDYGGFAGVFVYYFYGRDFHRLALNYIQVAVGTSGVFDSEVKVDIGEVVFVVACCERQQRQREQHHREDFIHNSNMA